jgi:hypothetical protein
MVDGHIDGSEIPVGTIQRARELKRICRWRVGAATATTAASATAGANPNGAGGDKTELP